MEEYFLDENELIKFIAIGDHSDFDIEFEINSDDEILKNKLLNLLDYKGKNDFSKLEETDEDYKLLINGVEFVNVSKKTGEVKIVNQLCTTETRLMANGYKNVPFSRDEVYTQYSPRTDLNSYFTGAPRAEILIELGKKHDLEYPIKLLEKIGVNLDKNETSKIIQENNAIKLSDLNSDNLKKLENRLKFSPLKVETLNDREEIYKLRKVFTKNKKLFPELLNSIAEDYQKNGIEYAELSFSEFLYDDLEQDSTYLEMLEEYLPEIEEKTGVKLRFLVGISQNTDEELRLQNIETIKELYKASPYIVGCDFRGDKIPEKIWKTPIEKIVEFAEENNENFVIKVSVGENKRQDDNLREIINIIENAHTAKKKYPQIHINNPFYGWNTVSVERANLMSPVISFGLGSALANNNMTDFGKNSFIATIKKIKGLKNSKLRPIITSGTFGMYGISSSEEKRLFQLLGLDKKDFEKISNIEEKLIESIKIKSNEELKNEDLITSIKKSIELRQKYKAKKEKEISEKYDEKERILGEEKLFEIDELKKTLDGKTPILISGSSGNTWTDIQVDQKKEIEIALKLLASLIDPEKAYIVTGGTNVGVEKLMHEIVYNVNSSKEKKIDVVGTLVLNAKENQINTNLLTYATILKDMQNYLENWEYFSSAQLDFAKDGILIAIGGGQIVGDMIIKAHNNNMKKLLMNGPFGKSTEISQRFPEDAFQNAKELIMKLYAENSEIFDKDFKIEKIDDIITKTIKESKDDETKFLYRALNSNSDEIELAKNGETIYSEVYYEEDEYKRKLKANNKPELGVANGDCKTEYISTSKKIGNSVHKYSIFGNKEKRSPIIVIDVKKLNTAIYDFSNDDSIKEIMRFQNYDENFKKKNVHVKKAIDYGKSDFEVKIHNQIPAQAYKIVPPVLADILDICEREARSLKHIQEEINEIILSDKSNDLLESIKDVELNDVEQFVFQKYYEEEYTMKTICNEFRNFLPDSKEISDVAIIDSLTGIKANVVKKIINSESFKSKLKITEKELKILNKAFFIPEGIISASATKSSQSSVSYYQNPNSAACTISREQKLIIDGIKKDKKILLPEKADVTENSIQASGQSVQRIDDEPAKLYSVDESHFVQTKFQGKQIKFDPQKLREYLDEVENNNNQETKLKQDVEKVLREGISLSDVDNAEAYEAKSCEDLNQENEGGQLYGE